MRHGDGGGSWSSVPGTRVHQRPPSVHRAPRERGTGSLHTRMRVRVTCTKKERRFYRSFQFWFKFDVTSTGGSGSCSALNVFYENIISGSGSCNSKKRCKVSGAWYDIQGPKPHATLGEHQETDSGDQVPDQPRSCTLHSVYGNTS